MTDDPAWRKRRQAPLAASAHCPNGSQESTPSRPRRTAQPARHGKHGGRFAVGVLELKREDRSDDQSDVAPEPEPTEQPAQRSWLGDVAEHRHRHHGADRPEREQGDREGPRWRPGRPLRAARHRSTATRGWDQQGLADPIGLHTADQRRRRSGKATLAKKRGRCAAGREAELNLLDDRGECLDHRTDREGTSRMGWCWSREPPRQDLHAGPVAASAAHGMGVGGEHGRDTTQYVPTRGRRRDEDLASSEVRHVPNVASGHRTSLTRTPGPPSWEPANLETKEMAVRHG